jgi:hypothetical protein
VCKCRVLTMPTCKLCEKDRPLVDAHVVPKAFWAIPQNGEEPPRLMSNTKGEWPKRIRRGIYDNTILCAQCDGLLGKLHQHAAETLLRSRTNTITDPRGKPLARQYLTADPLRITRFIASVAWRASISSHPVYHRVRLGPYEERVRQLLLRDDAKMGEVEAFLGEFDQDDVPPLDPHCIRIEGARFWLIYAKRWTSGVRQNSWPTTL